MNILHRNNFLISNVTLWRSSGVFEHVDIWVVDGIVEAIIPTQNLKLEAGSITGDGKCLLPAGLDLQTHLRVPGQLHKETPFTGLRAALRGGYAAVLAMPNTKPIIDVPRMVERARNELAEAEATLGVKVFLSAAVTIGQEGRELVSAHSLKEAGVVALTDDGRGVADSLIMKGALKASSTTGLPLLQHAEFPNHGGCLHPGQRQEMFRLAPYPDDPEWKMVERDLELLRDFPNAKYHVLHVSSQKTLRLVSEAKRSGLPVTCEVSPHHLYFCADDVQADNGAFKMNPPLRSGEDRSVLQAALADGTIDFVATDHAPHEREAKRDSESAAFGTIGLETCLRVLLSLVEKEKLSPQRLVQVFSSAPARFLGVEDEYGDIAEGRPFHAVLIDPKSVSRVTEDDFESLSKNSCFLGTELPGEVLAVFNRDWVAQLANI